MERQKSILGRKKKGPAAAPGDFIALGKPSKSGESDLKRPLSPQHIGRKKDSPSGSISSASLSKKPKLGGSAFTPSSRLGEGSTGSSSLDDISLSVEPTDFLSSILAADDEMNDERSEALLCGAVKHLRNNRAKPDPVIYLSLMHLSKTRPALFCSDVIVEAFCGLLKRDMALSFKAKGNPLVSVLACNILMTAFADEQNWPDDFIKVFVEDSLGERVWVDREDCRCFTDNLLTAFGTKKSPKHLLTATMDLAARPDTPGASSPSQIGVDDDDFSKSEKNDGDNTTSSAVFPRYPCQLAAIETYILDTIRDVLNRRQAMDSSSRNLIRLMSSTSGIAEVRSMAAQRMDMWLQNPKLTRVSQDLLLAVCTNCDKHDKTDLEVMAHLTKMRLKTKALINHFLLCMRELLSQHPDNLRMILKYTVYNELSTSRNPNNMALFGIVFSHSSDSASKILAEIFQILLTNAEDYLRALRILLREIVRVTRLDMNFSAFCLSLMQERTELASLDATLKERYIVSIADLIAMDVLLSVAPNVRDAATAIMQGDHKNLELIHVFKKQVAVIQRDSVWWLHTVVPKIIELKAKVYFHCLKKVLFLETADQYYNKDNWPPESERGLMLRLVSESLVLEDTLMRILVIGLWRDLPLSPPDAVELVDQLVCRATNLYDLGLKDVLHMERLEFFDALLNLCAYKHPDSITLPAGYTPPNLAITGLKWKAWLVLLIITAYNPTVFGERAWQTYPTLQFFMEMAMTNNYKFPPSTTATTEIKAEEYRAQERQIRQQEIHMIMEFETHLAAGSNVTITESTSLLIGQLNNSNPVGPARFPPPEIIEQLKTLNTNLKLGQMLCRSRDPDFLMRIIDRQGTSQSMPWLAELVESSEGSLHVLPVQCLCEFLLHGPTDMSQETDSEEFFEKGKNKHKNRKQEQLLSRLQDLVQNPSEDLKTVKEVLDYFFQRLASIKSSTREQAIKGLSLVVGPRVTCNEEDSFAMDSKTHVSDEWLSYHIPSLPLFNEVQESISLALRKACQVDTNVKRINSYILFLEAHTAEASQQTWNEMALDLAQLLVERTSVMNSILPHVTTYPILKTQRQRETLLAFIRMFLRYMQGARKEQKDTFSWSNSQDQILVQWESGQSATVHVLVVQAIIILLTYGWPREEHEHEDNEVYTELLDMWIQDDYRMPSAFLMDTSEEALLLPDWLKLRMLRSQDDRLVNAALLEVEPSQLVLFVQSFGIPISSMSRLLSALDQAANNDPANVSQALKDKTYLINLIDIQHQAGATGGRLFYAMLTKDQELPPKEKDIETTDEEKPTQNIWNVEGSGDVILPNSVDKISRLLDQIFSDSKGTEKGPAKLFQCFLQALSTDKGKAAAVIRSLDNLLSSSKKEAFAAKVFSTTFRSCPILKILIAKQHELHSELFSVMEKLQALGQGKKSMLTAIISQFLASYSASTEQHAKKAEAADTILEKIVRGNKLDTESLKKDMKEITDPHKLEMTFHKLMEIFMVKKHSKEGTRIVCEMLAEDGTSKMTSTYAKLLVDWLSLLDPEIINANPELQQQLLFAHKSGSDDEEESEEDDDRKSVASQAHLLALLTHQASWDTLKSCLTTLLQADRIPELDPTALLDFIWACAHIPKIWHGREKKAQEIDTAEDILGLSGPQLRCIVDLITVEATMMANANMSMLPEQQLRPMIPITRVNLLLSCICDDMERVKACVLQLDETHSSCSSPRKEIAVNLAVQLYLHFPCIQAFIPDSLSLLDQLFKSSHLISQIDVISHRLITSLSQTKAGAKAENQMYDANLACRKLAAHHPTIFLRQLPLISSVLSGQTFYKIGEMRHTNRLQLFTHVLGLLELLQPHLFKTEHRGLFATIDSFFALMQNHGKEQKALGSLVYKFVLILQNFLTHNPDQAFPFLTKYMEYLVVLGHQYPDMVELKALTTNLMLPRQTEAQSKYQHTTKVTECQELISASGSYTAPQLAPFMRRLSKESSEELLQALQDLDEMSKRKVEILGYFQSQLEKLMMCQHDQCRGTAFTLVMRSLRHNPRKAKSFVSVYLDCLENENPNVVTSALKNFPEFTALCQEEAPTLLQKAFTVGIKMSIDTSSFISEALQMLNLHSASAQ